MRRYLLALVIALYFCSGWPATTMGGSAPTSGDAGGGGTIFSEDCSDLSDWTDASNNASVDVSSNQCLGNVVSDAGDANILRGPLDTTSEFCSMKVITVNGGQSNKVGCVFRAPATPGTHYTVWFNNNGNNYAIENHNDSHGFVNEVKGVESCGCTYTDINNSDYAGITVSGTSTSTAVSWYDFGASPPADLEDPSTWGTATCECDATEISTASSLSLIDAAGDCGPEMTSNSANEITIDDFACGDTP